MTTALKMIRESANRIQLEIEEILDWLPEDLTIGDDGVAELVVQMENTSSLLSVKLKKKS